jgi:hypothetical protein
VHDSRRHQCGPCPAAGRGLGVREPGPAADDGADVRGGADEPGCGRGPRHLVRAGQRGTGEPSQRCRERQWDTWAGTIGLGIPKLRQGSYFPEWLLERRAEQALISVAATPYLRDVSTRRVEKLAGSLGITSLSKSQVNELAKNLDGAMEQFRSGRSMPGPTGSCKPMASGRSSAWTSPAAKTVQGGWRSSWHGRPRPVRGGAGDL